MEREEGERSGSDGGDENGDGLRKGKGRGDDATLCYEIMIEMSLGGLVDNGTGWRIHQVTACSLLHCLCSSGERMADPETGH